MRVLMLECVHGKWTELEYASCVAKKYAEQLRKEGHEVLEVEAPTPSRANDEIRRFKPDVIWFVGHGYTDRATLEKMKLWVDCRMPLTQFKDRVVVAHSCLTGVKLGKVSISKGTRAYFGYTDNLWFMWCNDATTKDTCPCSGKNPYGIKGEVWYKIVTYPHRPSLEFLKALVEKGDPQEAFKHSLEATNRMIAELENTVPHSQTEQSMIKLTEWILRANRKHQVLYIGTGGKIESNKGKRALVLIPVVMVLELITLGRVGK